MEREREMGREVRRGQEKMKENKYSKKWNMSAKKEQRGKSGEMKAGGGTQDKLDDKFVRGGRMGGGKCENKDKKEEVQEAKRQGRGG